MINLNSRIVVFMMASCVLFLLICHLIGMMLKFGFGSEFFFGFVPLTDFDREDNLPTLYSTLSLIFCAGLLAFIGIVQYGRTNQKWLSWLTLSVIFLIVAIDEAISIHEQLILPVRNALNASGIFHFAWVIPYGILVILLVIFYAPFVFRMPRKVKLLSIAAAGVFLTGAIGCEMLGGYIFESNGESLTLQYAFVTTLEELLEMTGVLIFVYALMVYIETELNGIVVNVCTLPAHQTENNVNAPVQ